MGVLIAWSDFLKDQNDHGLKGQTIIMTVKKRRKEIYFNIPGYQEKYDHDFPVKEKSIE